MCEGVSDGLRYACAAVCVRGCPMVFNMHTQLCVCEEVCDGRLCRHMRKCTHVLVQAKMWGCVTAVCVVQMLICRCVHGQMYIVVKVHSHFNK